MKVSRAAIRALPLGDPFGEVGRPDHQLRVLEDLLDLLESADGPDTLVELPHRWRRMDVR